MNLLIVDDEVITTVGISNALDWNLLGFDNIFTANSADDAELILKEQKIDLLISDVEMPYKDGIRFVEEIRPLYPHLEILFLSGHDKFEYVKKAISLGVSDYLLKPIKSADLQKVIEQKVKKINEDKVYFKNYEMYRRFYEMWEQNKYRMVENFWRDVLSEYILYTKPKYRQYFNEDIPDENIVLILLSIQGWNEQYDTMDENIMEYGIRNIAEEMFLESKNGVVFQDNDGNNWIIIFDNESSAYEKLCHDFIENCRKYLDCEISCYTAHSCRAENIIDTKKQLLSMEYSNITRLNTVISETDTAVDDMVFSSHNFKSEIFCEFVDSGMQCKCINWICSLLNKENDISTEVLEGFSYGLISSIYKILHSKGISVKEVYENNLHYVKFKTIEQCRDWAVQTAKELFDYLDKSDSNDTVIIAQVKKYIKQHIGEELSRQSIAESVFLNPSYLSRLFKKSTSVSLTDYIVAAKIDKAKEILRLEGAKVSTVAGLVGYDSFSYFSKVFKRYVGVSPNEYAAMHYRKE